MLKLNFLKKKTETQVDKRSEYLSDFLDNEIRNSDMTNEILHFINSPEIRRGEFECNEYIIQKIDANCFLLYSHLVGPDGEALFGSAFSMYRSELQAAILSQANTRGFDSALNASYIQND